MTWLINNIGTIIVLCILIAIVVLIVKKLIHDKRQGRSTCGCGCQNCAMAGVCHKQ